MYQIYCRVCLIFLDVAIMTNSTASTQPLGFPKSHLIKPCHGRLSLDRDVTGR
jgi:hypothetical protein